MLRWRFAFAVGTCLGAGSARAQGATEERAAPPPTELVLVPPRPATSTEVAYPPGARGNSEVVLELLIAADGRVDGAAVESGEDPFATAASTAALTWRFEPATRGDVPIAAHIRFRVTFTEPELEREPEPTSEPTRGPATQQPGPVPQSVRPLEVLVVGERPPPGRRSLGRAEVRQLPGAFGDPFRSIEVMPGVVPLVSGAPFFYVRGAPPGNVGYFLDGVRVPLLYHIGLGPGVIHPGLVERVDLHPGGYPARYGRYAGAIVAAETTAPAYDWHGEGSARIFDAGVLAEGPWASGRGTVAAAGRYSYTAAILSLAVPELQLDYWDYQVRGTYDVDHRRTLGVFAFGAYDFLGEEERGVVRTLFASEFHRVDLRLDQAHGGRTRSRTAVTLGFDRTRAGGDRRSESLAVIAKSVGGRVEVEHRASEAALVRAGADVLVDHYATEVTLDDEDGDRLERDLARVLPPRTDFTAGARGDVVLDADAGVTVTPGARVDAYVSRGVLALAVDPRVAARFELSDRFALIHAFGVAHQPPSFVIPIPGFEISSLDGGLQKALQSSAGVEGKLSGKFVATATVFHNAFFDMTDQLGLVTSPIESDLEVDTRTFGHAYGLELMLARPLSERLGGFVSYTLSRSTRALGRYRLVSSFDRTHVAHAAAAYDLGKRWRMGSRVTFYTGIPAQIGASEEQPASPTGVPPSSSDRVVDAELARSPPRTEPFFRLDLRLEKRWPVGTRGAWVAFIFEWLNATLSREVIEKRCTSASSCESEAIGPVSVPSVGVEAAF